MTRVLDYAVLQGGRVQHSRAEGAVEASWITPFEAGTRCHDDPPHEPNLLQLLYQNGCTNLKGLKGVFTWLFKQLGQTFNQVLGQGIQCSHAWRSKAVTCSGKVMM